MNFKNSFVCSSLFCLVKITPPRIFDSNNLGTPSIQVISGEQAVAVSLLCKVDLLQGIEQRDDVEYKIEWTSEGKTLRIKSRCDQKDRIPCPNTNSIVSTLIGFTDYLAGIWVMYFVSLFFYLVQRIEHYILGVLWFQENSGSEIRTRMQSCYNLTIGKGLSKK